MADREVPKTKKKGKKGKKRASLVAEKTQEVEEKPLTIPAEEEKENISHENPALEEDVAEKKEPADKLSTQTDEKVAEDTASRDNIVATGDGPSEAKELEREETTEPSKPLRAPNSLTENYSFDNSGFDDLDEMNMEEEDEDYHYEPPSKKEKPDLYKLMETLESGETDLESSRQPLALFEQPQHVPNYEKISELKLQMEEEEIDAYVDSFEDKVKEDVLMIGSISLDEVQEEERRLRDEHIAYQQQETALARKRQEEILLREEQAKKQVSKTLKAKRKEIERREELSLLKERLIQDKLHKAFRRSEGQLFRALQIRKAEIKTLYGDLTMADGQYGGSKGRRWKVDWNKTPQPIQVKLKCLRGVRDKLPAGNYVLITSLYDRLGGHVMKWSNLKGQQWGGNTLPMRHDGMFYNAEIKIDQSMFTVCPAKPDVRPGMILVFELFLMRGSLLPRDQVVGWGIFPISDGCFEVIEGKYKCPMLRGGMDPRIERHETLEKLMASDIDHWLCNLYFEVIKLPRYLNGQKEYEVELQFTSSLLGHPDRVKGAEEPVDGEEPRPGSREDLGSASGDSNPSDPKGSTGASHESLGSGNSYVAASTEGSEDSIEKDMKGNVFRAPLEAKKHTPVESISEKEVAGLRRRPQPGTKPPPTAVVSSRKILDKQEKGRESESEYSDEEDERYQKEKNDGFIPVVGASGLYYKKHVDNPANTYHQKRYAMLPKTPVLNKKRKKKKLSYLEELETYNFAVQKPFSGKGSTQQVGREKADYVGRQFLSELGLSQWRSREFWLMMIMFILTWFARMYLHYCGQWAFLQIIKTPISQFNFKPYTVDLNYQASLLYTREEILVVLMGPFTNILLFTLFILTNFLCQITVGSFPGIGSKLCISFGIMTILDPILILIVDMGLKRYLEDENPLADAAKLYYHFLNLEGNGIVGIFMTLFLYFFTIFTASVILYMYFLRLHNNGRMLDVYHRLHGSNEDFFVPYDMEVSVQELSFTVRKSEQWRGAEGERRKTTVYDYIWEEEQVEDVYWDEEGEHREVSEGRKEITTHVAVHTLHLDGLRELHRHFLRLPDGAIVEVFGDMGVAGIDKDLRKALTKGAQGIENLGSQLSLSKTHNRPKTTGGLGSMDLINKLRSEEEEEGEATTSAATATEGSHSPPPSPHFQDQQTTEL